MITKEALEKMKEKESNFSEDAFKEAAKVSKKLILDKPKMDMFKKLLIEHGPDSKELIEFIIGELGGGQIINEQNETGITTVL